MGQPGVHLSPKEFYFLLQGCITKKDLLSGRKLRRLIIQEGFQSNPFLGSHLIRLFALCGSLLEANEVFDELHEPTIFAWSAIILAHTKLGKGEQAIHLYHQMQSKVKPNEYIFVAVLKACSSTESLDRGKLIHAQIMARNCELNIFVGNSLIDMYAKCGSLNDARIVFENLSNRNVATWIAMIAGFVQHKRHKEALQLFRKMLVEGIQPNDITFVCTLKACCSSSALGEGKYIHDLVEKSCYVADLVVGNTLIYMYAKCGSLQDARRVFDESPKQNVVTWNTMITGYAQNGNGEEALQLFQEMQEVVEPNDVTFACILKACSSISALEEGKLIHAHIIKHGGELESYVGSTLIDMYTKCKSLKDARNVKVCQRCLL